MPRAIERPCTICTEPLASLEASLGFLSHPTCIVPGMQTVELPDETPAPAVQFARVNPKLGACPLPDVAENVKAELITMVRMFEEFSPRKQQLSLGPSDLGVDCDRSLGYKIAGLTGHNMPDPWPAFVGSAIHARMERVIKEYGPQVGGAWLIEERVQVDPMIAGHADLVKAPWVVDLKSAGPDMMKKIGKEGPPRKYLIQINAYAKGLRDAGHQIDTVCFVFLPRSGWLTGMLGWAAPYDEALALEAIARPYAIRDRLVELDIMTHPHRWQLVDATPGDSCIWCPMYDKHRMQDQGADDKGCPGKNV
jgi:hypothetical protein